MAEELDPYHVWLGIPQAEQPANHYRLLGIRLFETNGDVIDSAADRQMAHLRTFQGGKNGELTQQLLNEVAAARVCLLDAKRRAAYDKPLEATLPEQDATAEGSAVRRTEPRRAAGAVAAPTEATTRAVAPKPVDQWAEILGDPTAKPAARPGAKSIGSGAANKSAANKTAAKVSAAKEIAAKRAAKNSNISIGITAGVVLIAAIGIAVFSMGTSDGTLVFDWPLADRVDTTVTVDRVPVPIPTRGSWQYQCPAGEHHVVAQQPGYKLDANVTVAAGERKAVPADWKAKATLVLNWPLPLRVGADLRIDGRAHAFTQSEPLEIAVEPGRHVIQIGRPPKATIVATATVAPDGRELVAITPPPEPSKLVFDWPTDKRKDAELTIDGRTVAAGSEESLELTLDPGRHVVQITRAGFEPFSQAVDLAEGANQSIKPTWTPVQKTAPAVAVEAPARVETAQPAKKLPVPAAAEQERIAKQLDDLYKTSHPGKKDPALAQQLYEVAAKTGASAAERYMLLMKRAEIAAAAGDLNLSLQGIDTLDASYEFNALETKQKLLEKIIAVGKADQVALAIRAAEQMVEQAVAADEYEIALMLATTASHAVTKSTIPDRKAVEDRLSRRRRDIRLIQTTYAATKKAEEALAKNPADPEADLIVGRWRCLFKQDWAGGLPLLAKGSDETLKSLAGQDLKKPTDAGQQVQLADEWWDLAQKEAGAARDSLHLHAADIYQAALPNLTSALKKAAIGKRLEEIANLPRPASNTPASLQFPVGQWVDVLRLIDPIRDSVLGTWKRNGDELTCEPGAMSKIALPVIVDGGYDLEVEFTRNSGKSDVVAGLWVGAHPCAASVSAANGGVSGLMKLDGHDVNSRDDPIVVHPGTIENRRRYPKLFTTPCV